MEDHRLLQGLPDGLARIEGGVRILEDHLHAAAERQHRLGGFIVDAFFTVENLAVVGGIDADGGAGQGRLAAAALTDHAEGLSGSDGETHVIDGLDRGALTGQPAAFESQLVEEAAGDVEVFDHVLEFQQVAARIGNGMGACCLHRVVCPGSGVTMWQATWRVRWSTGISGGS
ncbi:hypothetical protein DESC_780087 [Desulfosarcina cetonica]|nr:hypothetical protein DESC_780087 [Desulfosarcina cetonica]